MTNENAQKVRALYLDSFNVKETMSQLQAGGKLKLMSWGFRNPTNFEDKGLLFRVSGFKHKGYVLITLAFDDTYTVHLLNLKCEIVKKMEMVYCDELTERIDNEVEKVQDYEAKVKKEYGWK
jgi:hypothetical protein